MEMQLVKRARRKDELYYEVMQGKESCRESLGELSSQDGLQGSVNMTGGGLGEWNL